MFVVASEPTFEQSRDQWLKVLASGWPLALCELQAPAPAMQLVGELVAEFIMNHDVFIRATKPHTSTSPRQALQTSQASPVTLLNKDLHAHISNCVFRCRCNCSMSSYSFSSTCASSWWSSNTPTRWPRGGGIVCQVQQINAPTGAVAQQLFTCSCRSCSCWEQCDAGRATSSDAAMFSIHLALSNCWSILIRQAP